jgi:hypothetical protein
MNGTVIPPLLRETKVRFVLSGTSLTEVLPLREFFAHRLVLVRHQSYVEDNRPISAKSVQLI